MMFKRDQNGVVWFERGFMSAAAYRELCKHDDTLMPYDQLEVWDSHNQNIVEVD